MTTNYNPRDYNYGDRPAGEWQPLRYTMSSGGNYTTNGTNGPASRTSDEAQEAKTAAAIANSKADVASAQIHMTQAEVEKLKTQNREQKELIDILTEGLVGVRKEMEGITEGVRQLAGERDYWKEIAANLGAQKKLYEEELDRLSTDEA